MKIIRTILGKIILFLDALFSPKAMQRTLAQQTKADQETKMLILYQYEACPFCVKVRRSIKRLNLKIELRDAAKVAIHKEELVRGGGKNQVPCLKITDASTGNTQWMYESNDIIHYLEKKYQA